MQQSCWKVMRMIDRNTTKTKIKTQHGTILKVTTYEYGEQPDIEYKVRTHCVRCGCDTGCLCFQESEGYSIKDVIAYAPYELLCDKNECIIEFESQHDPELLKILQDKYKNDEIGLAQAIEDSWCGADCGPTECGV
jgi:hypothetical protein